MTPYWAEDVVSHALDREVWGIDVVGRTVILMGVVSGLCRRAGLLGEIAFLPGGR